MRIGSPTMMIEVRAGSLRYRYESDAESEEYEVTGVSAEHVDALVRADVTEGYSPAKTVEVLTYLHRNEHFDSAGRLVPPASGWERDEEGARSAIDHRGNVRI